MVMPCSRSARRPSVSSAKSSVPAVWLTEAFLRGRDLVFVNALGIVQQAADQGGFAVIHAAGGGEPQQILLLVLPEKAFDVRRWPLEGCRHQKYPSRFLISIDPSWS